MPQVNGGGSRVVSPRTLNQSFCTSHIGSRDTIVSWQASPETLGAQTSLPSVALRSSVPASRAEATGTIHSVTQDQEM